MSDELQDSLERAQLRFDHLVRCRYRRENKIPCEGYEQHEFTTEQSIAGGFMTDNYWQALGIEKPEGFCDVGENRLRCLVCGRRFITDYCMQHPIEIGEDGRALNANP